MSTKATTVETIAPTDVLVAVSDPAANAVLTMANELYWAAVRYGKAEESYQDACGKEGCTEYALRSRRISFSDAGKVLDPLSTRYEQLMASIADEDLYQQIEQTVWRDREAEYARNREISERKHAR